MITPEKMKEIGTKVYNCSWTDQELKDQIKALELVIAYFRGRGDAKLLLSPFVLDLNRFKDMQISRK